MANRKVFEYRSTIKASADQVLNWHWKPGVMPRLVPPWEPVEVIKAAEGPQDGQRAILRLSFGPLKIDWVAEHCDYIEGKQFADKQVSGPFAYWYHLHRVEPVSPHECVLVDRVEYELPLAPLSTLIADGMVRQKLTRMFKYRHEVTASDLNNTKQTG